jgi:carbon monoxide dehydrogenase subunit G
VVAAEGTHDRKETTMEVTGEHRIPVPRQQVWEALNDPEILRQCIPGCESLEKISDTRFAAKLLPKIGPVKTRFSTTVTLSNLEPPVSYTISGEGQGGAAGFAKGVADITLEEDGHGTIMRYAARIQAGGKLAQVGSRLLGGTARKMADDFFSNLAARLGAAPPREAISPVSRRLVTGLRVFVWIAVLVVLVVLVLWAINSWY